MNGAIPLSTWTHLAATYDKAADRMSFWVDGVNVAQQAATSDIAVSGNSVFIGGNAPFGEYFAGLIDGVRLSDRPLEIVEIQTNMVTPPAR